MRNLLYTLDKFFPVYGRDKILVAKSQDGINWTRHIRPIIDTGHNHDYDMAYWPLVWKQGQEWHIIFTGTDNLRRNERTAALYHGTSSTPYEFGNIKKVRCHGDYNMCPRLLIHQNQNYLVWTNGDAQKSLRIAPFDNMEQDNNLIVHQNNTPVLCDDFHIYQNIMVGAFSSDSKSFFLARSSKDITNWQIDSVVDVQLPEASFINNPSLVYFNNEWKIYFRASNRTSWGSKIWMTTSKDLETWSLPLEVLDYSGLKRKNLDQSQTTTLLEKLNNHELGGVGFASPVVDEKSLYLYYAGFWGIHLLMPYTYWNWRLKN